VCVVVQSVFALSVQNAAIAEEGGAVSLCFLSTGDLPPGATGRVRELLILAAVKDQRSVSEDLVTLHSERVDPTVRLDYGEGVDSIIVGRIVREKMTVTFCLLQALLVIEQTEHTPLLVFHLLGKVNGLDYLTGYLDFGRRVTTTRGKRGSNEHSQS
jgi:hypothetical protein